MIIYTSSNPYFMDEQKIPWYRTVKNCLNTYRDEVLPLVDKEAYPVAYDNLFPLVQKLFNLSSSGDFGEDSASKSDLVCLAQEMRFLGVELSGCFAEDIKQRIDLVGQKIEKLETVLESNILQEKSGGPV